MAIFTPGPIIGSISGTVGGVNFARNGTTGSIRAIPTKTKHESTALAAAFAAIQFYNIQWQSLTAQQKAAWQLTAIRLTETTRLGTKKSLSAKALFLRCHLNRHNRAELFTTPPQPLSCSPFPTMSFSCTFGSSILNISYSDPTKTAPDIAFIYLARSFRAKTATAPAVFHNWRYIIKLDNPTLPYNLFSAATAALGTLSTSEWYCCRLVSGDYFGRTSKPTQLAFQGA